MLLTSFDLDIICQIVDNYGDAGIACRLARSWRLYHPQATVRVIIDDLPLLSRLCPAIDPRQEEQVVQSITWIDRRAELLKTLRPAPLVVRLHESTLPDGYADHAQSESQLILVLPGLTAEAWAETIHGTESLTGQNARTFFFVSGFMPNTGGLLMRENTNSFKGKESIEKYFVLFSYEFSIENLLLALGEEPHTLVVCGERSQAMIRRCPSSPKNLRILTPDFMPQESFDALLRQSEMNFVRGEDSLAQAIAAGKPFLWQIYPQDDLVHIQKLSAFLDTIEPFFEDTALFETYRRLTRYYNQLEETSAIELTKSIHEFMKNLSSVRLSVERFREAIGLHGTLIERLRAFIKTIE